jgi:hypothetical protein
VPPLGLLVGDLLLRPPVPRLIRTLSEPLIGELVSWTLVGPKPLGVVDGRALEDAL